MAIRVGAIAEGEDFFDRVTELDDLWRYVEGNHILLSGPRRLGKSSLLKRFAEQATAQGILARLVDVEGIDNAGAFVAELVRAFPDESLSGYASSAGTALGSLLTRFRKMDSQYSWKNSPPAVYLRHSNCSVGCELGGNSLA